MNLGFEKDGILIAQIFLFGAYPQHLSLPYNAVYHEYLCAIHLHHLFQKPFGQYPVIPVLNNPLAASFAHGLIFF